MTGRKCDTPSIHFLKYWRRIENVTEEKENLLYRAYAECKDDFHKLNNWAANVNSMLKLIATYMDMDSRYNNAIIITVTVLLK